MMPLAYPVVGQINVERVLHTRVQIELQLVVPFLNNTELGVSLGDIGGSLVGTAQLTGLHIETDGEGLARQLHIVTAVHFHPLVVSAQVQHAFLHLGISHEVYGGVERRAVFQRTDMLGETGIDEIPDGTTHQTGMATDGRPVFIQSATCITCHGEVFVHERRTGVFALGHHGGVHLQLVRCRVARTDDIFAGMGVSITAVHEIACGVEALAFVHHLGDERTFATLITRTPEEHTGMIAVAQHQLLHTLQVHPAETLVVRDILRGVSLGTSLVDDVQTILVGQLQVFVHGRIV